MPRGTSMILGVIGCAVELLLAGRAMPAEVTTIRWLVRWITPVYARCGPLDGGEPHDAVQVAHAVFHNFANLAVGTSHKPGAMRTCFATRASWSDAVIFQRATGGRASSPRRAAGSRRYDRSEGSASHRQRLRHIKSEQLVGLPTSKTRWR